MTFKETIINDIENVFFNNNEFSEIAEINGREMSAVFDTDEYNKTLKISGKYFDGMYRADLILYVKASEYGVRPKNGSLLTIARNSKTIRYRITDVDEESGVYIIGLEANRA